MYTDIVHFNELFLPIERAMYVNARCRIISSDPMTIDGISIGKWHLIFYTISTNI